jgi:hypothetical protein
MAPLTIATAAEFSPKLFVPVPPAVAVIYQI